MLCCAVLSSAVLNRAVLCVRRHRSLRSRVVVSFEDFELVGVTSNGTSSDLVCATWRSPHRGRVDGMAPSL